MSEQRKIDFKINVDQVAVLRPRIENHEFISGPELAIALRGLGDRPVPVFLRDSICDFLEGKIKSKRGRRPAPKQDLLQQVWVQRAIYQKCLRWAKLRRKRQCKFPALGKESWDNMCYDMPANEVAARLAARRLGLGDDAWRTLQNRLSSQK